MDRYNENKTNRGRKIKGFFKTIIVLSMIVGLGLSILFVNDTMKDLNFVDNTVLFGIDYNSKTFTLLGKSYMIELDKVFRFIKPD